MVPQSRTEFKQWVLRKLGAPVVSINLDDSQIEDLIDEGLQFYQRNHYNGSEQVYVPYLVDATVKSNKFLFVPATMTGVTRVFQLQNTSSSNILSTEFMVMSDALWQALRGTGLASYVQLQQYRNLISQLTVGEKPIRFNRTVGKVHVDANWESIPLNSYLVIEGWSAVDPDTNTLIWSDDWFQRYVVQLVKSSWGTVLKKYTGVQLPGGITLDGASLYNEAEESIKDLKEELKTTYSLPPMMMVG